MANGQNKKKNQKKGVRAGPMARRADLTAAREPLALLASDGPFIDASTLPYFPAPSVDARVRSGAAFAFLHRFSVRFVMVVCFWCWVIQCCSVVAKILDVWLIRFFFRKYMVFFVNIVFDSRLEKIL